MKKVKEEAADTPTHNIVELFLGAAAKYPEKLAIIDPKGSIYYVALEEDVKKTAAYFHKKGIQKGDRVLVFVPMGIDLYRIVLALFYLGATAVFLDEWVNKKRLEICCQIADCKGFVGVFKACVLALFSKELRQIPIHLNLRKKEDNLINITPVKPSSTALITFTTGSTGIPKAADRTHGFLQEQFNALLDEVEPKVTDVDMPALPIVLFVNLGIGCTSVIADFKMTKLSTFNAAKISNQIKKNKVNRITASPFFIKKIAEHVVEHHQEHQQIEKIFTGGAPVFPDEAALYLKAFPTTSIKIVYGSTEAEPISAISAKNLVNRKQELSSGLPVGEPYSKIKLKIISWKNESVIDMTEAELQQNEMPETAIGEIIVSGNHVLKQYFKNEVAFNENKIVVNETIWHRTGDSGYLKDGQLYLTGRCKQLIQQQGEFTSPFIVENQLQQIKGVELGTILSINNRIIIVLETQLVKDELGDSLKNFSYDELKIVRQIPRDLRHNSKIDYEKLKEEFE